MIETYFLKNLETLLEQNDLNQLQFSKLISIPQGTINNWFKRKNIPNTETIEKLANYFKVQPYYFFMEPGTQGSIKPAKRNEDFDTFIDELAEKYLSPQELETYISNGGASEYLKALRLNYETPMINTSSYCLKLNSILTKYTSIDLIEKVRTSLSGQALKKA